MKHRFEYILLISFQWFLKQLPVDAASAFGGWLARFIGPRTSKQAIARKQLRHFFPEIPPKAREKILRDMWDNLGRSAAEFLILPSDELTERVTVRNPENLPTEATAAIYLTAHIGNWELLPVVVAIHGAPMVIMHRPATNPLTRNIIDGQRMNHAHALASKNSSGLGKAVRALKENRPIGMLTDQRISNGVERPFFGQPAFTSNLPAELAVKYGAKLIPASVIRKEGCWFETTVYPEIRWGPTGNTSADIERITDAINAHYEAWIKAHPEQWLWFHERWGKGKFI